MLQAKLNAQKLLKEKNDKKQAHQELCDNAWGNHIRTYVYHPYQMVRDSRTGHQSTQINSVKNGDLEEFMHASLIHFRKAD
jgi:peptide chain release factor 2